MGRRLKRLGYRAHGSVDLVAHAEHWRGFEFQSGPVIVALTGPWGCIQVWAASEAEGKRVVRHAASIAAIDEADGEWRVASDSSGRSDAVRTYRVVEVAGDVGVSTRVGPNGPASVFGS